MTSVNCPRCNGDWIVEIARLDQAQREHLCQDCGLTFAEVRYRPHRYEPTLLYMIDFADLEPATFTVDPQALPVMPRYTIGKIYCGPPADYPLPPTPEELLAHAPGLHWMAATSMDADRLS